MLLLCILTVSPFQVNSLNVYAYRVGYEDIGNENYNLGTDNSSSDTSYNDSTSSNQEITIYNYDNSSDSLSSEDRKIVYKNSGKIKNVLKSYGASKSAIDESVYFQESISVCHGESISKTYTSGLELDAEFAKVSFSISKSLSTTDSETTTRIYTKHYYLSDYGDKAILCLNYSTTKYSYAEYEHKTYNVKKSGKDGTALDEEFKSKPIDTGVFWLSSRCTVGLYAFKNSDEKTVNL